MGKHKSKTGGKGGHKHSGDLNVGRAGKSDRKKKNKLRNVTPTPAKLSVYKRPTVYPTLLPQFAGPRDRFLTPNDKEFDTVMDTSYRGAVLQPTSSFPASFHSKFKPALLGLEEAGVFQYDITQPAGLGTKIATTFVTRCLVGAAGSTYKYLGLRMFSIPWEEGEPGASPHSVAVGRLNAAMVQRSRELLERHSRQRSGSGSEVGSCDYNLTLINRCFPSKGNNDGSGGSRELKLDTCFGKDRMSVSWHADSSLEHFSTIGVYHCLVNSDSDHSSSGSSAAPSTPAAASASSAATPYNLAEDAWKIALRVWYDAEGPNVGRPGQSRAAEMRTASGTNAYTAPPVAFGLPDNSAYFLLDDFNHHHQHAVMPGSDDRFGSTHRVCRTDGHTFQSIKSRCVSALQQGPGVAAFGAKHVRLEQLALSEVEFEWVRQFYVQGRVHWEHHGWWPDRLAELVRYCAQLNARTVKVVEALFDSSVGRASLDELVAASALTASSSSVPSPTPAMSPHDRKAVAKRLRNAQGVEVATFAALVELLGDRHTKRAGWTARIKDATYKALPPECAPISVPSEFTDDALLRALAESPVLRRQGKELFKATDTLTTLIRSIESWVKHFKPATV